MKQCTKCQANYPEEEFDKKGSGRATRCKKCVAEYFRNYYHNNPERKRKQLERNKKNKTISNELAQKIVLDVFTSGCFDCGETNILVLEFDHRSPEEKSFNIGDWMNKNSIAKLEQEIAKCDVVCANCHRIRTAKQFKTWRYAVVYPHSDKV